MLQELVVPTIEEQSCRLLVIEQRKTVLLPKNFPHYRHGGPESFKGLKSQGFGVGVAVGSSVSKAGGWSA